MEKTYTIEEVIQFTIGMLRGISVPAEYAEQIGLPVMHAIRNLKVVQQALEEQKVMQEMQNDKPEKPENGENDGRKAEAE